MVLATAVVLALAGAGSLAPVLVGHAAAYNWLQYNGDAQHSGDNVLESAISPATVASLQRLFRVTLPGVADGAPVYLSGVATSSGSQDLLFLTTKDGRILALSAHTGATVWSKQYGPGSCTVNNGSTPCYTTSSPAIDPNGQYVYSYGLDGYVHKYQVGNGTEVTGGGWPELVTLKPFNEKESPALDIATDSGGTSRLYADNGGYPGDNGDYQGHLTTIDLATGSQAVFNTLCSSQTVHFVETPGTPDCGQVQSAVWARAGAIYDAATGKIYVVTGNGDYNPSAGDWGDSVLALNPDGTGTSGGPLDSYTPADFQSLQNGDLDLGSTAPAVLPAPASSSVQNLGLQGGKDGILRLLNLDNLSGQGGPGHTGGELATVNAPSSGEVLTTPAVWVNPADSSTWAFVANDSGIEGIELTVNGSGTPGLQVKWSNGSGGFSPLVANGVLFYAANNDLRALDPTTGALLWQDTSIGGIHWESPVVANGVLYQTDESGNLTAWAPAAQATSTPTPSVVPPTSTPTATTTAAPSSTPSSTPTATWTPTATQTRSATGTPTNTPTAVATSTWTSTPTGTPSGGTALVLYDNQVESPWIDYSFGYSANAPCDTSTFNSPPCSYSITLEGWGALSFTYGSGSLSTSAYTTLDFYLQPNGLPLGDFGVLLTDPSGNQISNVGLTAANDLGVTATGFHHISVAVSTINPAGQLLGSIQIKNELNQSLPAIHVDDVRLLSSTAATQTATPTATSSRTPTSTPAQPSPTATWTSTATRTPTATQTRSATGTPTNTPTAVATSTWTSTPTGTPMGGTPLVLYDNQVESPWIDYSFGYSARTPCDTSTFNSPPCSYSITLRGWGALSFTYGSGSLSTSAYTTLDFYLQPNGLPLSDFGVLLTDPSGNQISNVGLTAANDLGVTATGFHHISVAVSTIDPAGQLLGSIQIKNELNQKLPAIHVDDVRLLP